jgi:hypothetical protein
MSRLGYSCRILGCFSIGAWRYKHELTVCVKLKRGIDAIGDCQGRAFELGCFFWFRRLCNGDDNFTRHSGGGRRGDIICGRSTSTDCCTTNPIVSTESDRTAASTVATLFTLGAKAAVRAAGLSGRIITIIAATWLCSRRTASTSNTIVAIPACRTVSTAFP